MKKNSCLLAFFLVICGCSDKSASPSDKAPSVQPSKPAVADGMKPADGSPAKTDAPKEPQKAKAPLAAVPLAWDFPNSRKISLPECKDDKVIFQGGNDCVAVKDLKNRLLVRRFENGELKVKEELWEDEVGLVTSDGYVITLKTRPEEHEAAAPSLPDLPLATGVVGLSRFVARQMLGTPARTGLSPLSRFLTTGSAMTETISVSVYGPDLKQVGRSAHIGKICSQTGCWEYEIFLFRGAGDELHVVWVPDHLGQEGKWTYFLRSVSLKTGKTLGGASLLEKSEVYASSPVGDRIREAVENARLNTQTYYWTRTRSVLYDQGKLLAKTDFVDDPKPSGPPADNCRFSRSVLLEMQTAAGPVKAEIIDDELRKLLATPCSKTAPRLNVEGYQLERRPGGGFMVRISLSAGEMVGGNFFREYDAASQPAGPVRKVDFTAMAWISDTAWRVGDGCSWELRSR